MATATEHYEKLLSGVYSWMLGGHDAGIERNARFFEQHAVTPRGSRVAIDLGAGCGFQSIPLARSGFDVTAIDTDAGLLEELRRHDAGRTIRTVVGDLMRFSEYVDAPAEIVVCMTDTVLHLESTDRVSDLAARVFAALEPGGRFIVTFRDLTTTIEGIGRFIPVRSDASRILTCFLEYEAERVRVHDLLYERIAADWQFSASAYYKLRIDPTAFRATLLDSGFSDVAMTLDRGLATFIAAK